MEDILIVFLITSQDEDRNKNNSGAMMISCVFRSFYVLYYELALKNIKQIQNYYSNVQSIMRNTKKGVPFKTDRVMEISLACEDNRAIGRSKMMDSMQTNI